MAKTIKNALSQRVNHETASHQNSFSTNSTDKEEASPTMDFQQDSTTTRPPDQIKEILGMMQLMMREIQLLKKSSLSNKTE